MSNFWFIVGFIAFLVIIFSGIYAFSFRPKLPRSPFDGFQVELHELISIIEELTVSGLPGAYVRILQDQSSFGIQFRKYLHAKGVFGIEAVYPKSGFDLDEVDRLKEYCLKEKLALTECADVLKDGSPSYSIDCGADSRTAIGLMEFIAARIFDTKLDGLFKVERSGILLFNQVVDDPDSKLFEVEEQRRILKQEFRQSIDSVGKDKTVFAVLTFCQLAGFLGLAYGLLVRALAAVLDFQVHWAMFQIVVFRSPVSIYWYDVACIILLILGLFSAFTKQFSEVIENEKDHSHEDQKTTNQQTPTSMAKRSLRVPGNIAAMILIILAVASWLI